MELKYHTFCGIISAQFTKKKTPQNQTHIHWYCEIGIWTCFVVYIIRYMYIVPSHHPDTANSPFPNKGELINPSGFRRRRPILSFHCIYATIWLTCIILFIFSPLSAGIKNITKTCNVKSWSALFWQIASYILESKHCMKIISNQSPIISVVF